MQEKFYQYHLTRELAKKHSHSTYLASPNNPQRGHGELEHQVVLIVFPGLLFPLWREHENVLQNAQSRKELRHPHVAPILDLGVEEGQPFVVREYFPNGSLRSRLKEISPQRLELQEALTIVSQVGETLAYAHEHQILHGNIKPENVLFDANDHAILADFSLINGSDTYIRDQTSEEYAFCYMAPERFVGTYDARSDQYALGCLAYELITGQVPFTAQTLAAIKEHHTKTLPPPLSQSVANLPPFLEAAVLKTLAKDPAERFSDCSLFIEIIQSILSPPELVIVAQIEEEEAVIEISPPASSVHGRNESSLGWITSSLTKNTHISGLWSVQPPRGRTKLIGLGLLLSVSLILIAYAFWPLMTTSLDTSSHSITSIKHNPKRPNSAGTPEFVVVSTQKNHPVANPVARPIVTPSSILRAIPTLTPTPMPQPNPTPTVAPANADPYPPSGTLALNDPLSDNSRGYGWQETSDPSSNGGWACQFIGGAYHAIETQGDFTSCHASLQVSNFTFEVQMQIIQGACGGLILRDTLSQATTYYFQLCQNGSYTFERLDGLSAGWKTLASNSSGAIVTGLNQSNVIAAVADGGTFDLYINHQKIITINDSTYSQGQIGVAADSNSEVAYTNARMWAL